MQRRKRQIILPSTGKSHGRRSLVGCSPWGRSSRTQLSNFTFTFNFHALEKEMATHSSSRAWEIPWTVACQAPLSMGFPLYCLLTVHEIESKRLISNDRNPTRLLELISSYSSAHNCSLWSNWPHSGQRRDTLSIHLWSLSPLSLCLLLCFPQQCKSRRYNLM